MSGDWRDLAACKGMDTAMFYPQKSSGRFAPRVYERAVAKAKAICAQCPVRDECAGAGSDERFGIWGGHEPSERGHVPVRRHSVAECGTDSGYYRHRRLGTETCDACLAAHCVATVGREQRKREPRGPAIPEQRRHREAS